jgi:GxxExxY protein
MRFGEARSSFEEATMVYPAPTQDQETIANDVSKKIIGAAIEVHRILGPGLLESAYEECSYYELSLQDIALEGQVPLRVCYKSRNLDCGYRLELAVGRLVIVELKAVERIEPIHEAQLLTYLKLSNLWLGLLINFNVPVLKDGIRRIVNG